MKFSLKNSFFVEGSPIEGKSMLETKFKSNCVLHIVESICFCWVASCKKEIQISDRDITRLYLVFCTVHSWQAKEYKKGDVGQSVHENNKNQITLLYITLHWPSMKSVSRGGNMAKVDIIASLHYVISHKSRYCIGMHYSMCLMSAVSDGREYGRSRRKYSIWRETWRSPTFWPLSWRVEGKYKYCFQVHYSLTNRTKK